MLISVKTPTRQYDQGVRDFIAHFDSTAVMDRAYDDERGRYYIDRLNRNEREQIIHEIGRCQDDFEYVARNYFEIVDDKGNERPFALWPSQMLALEKYYELKALGRQQKIMIIKARRLGMSTLIESLMAWKTMFHPNQYGEIISYSSDHATYLFQMLLHILDKLPWWMKPMISSRKEEEGLVFDNRDQNDRRFNPGLQSKILVEAVTQVRGVGGQGKRVSCAHLSEWCDWDDDRAKTLIIEDLKPALGEDPEAFAFLESTAKGAGRFGHKFWRKNVRLKENAEWYPLFMPWFFEKSRVMSIPRPRASDGASAERWEPVKKELEMRDRAMRDWLKCTDTDCDEYREQAVYPELFDMPCPRCKRGKMMPVLLTDEQLRWMWHHRLNSEDDEKTRKLLKQEYASTAEEAFQVSGYQIFNDEIMEYANSNIREPLATGEFDSKGNFHGVKDPRRSKQCFQSWCSMDHTNADNCLQIWKFPEPGRSYVCGVDVSEGLGGQSDYSVIYVIKIGEFPGMPDEHVSTYRSNEIDPLPLGAICNFLGRWYNEALMSVECNKYDTTLSQLRQAWLYPNVFRWKWVDSTNMLSNKWGWWTNMSSKPRLYQTWKMWMKDRSIINYSSNCMEEMKTFQKESPEERGAAAEDNMFDDELMAAMIALYTAHDMDIGESVIYSTPLKVSNGKEIEAVGSWTAKCTRCPAPAWQCENPEFERCRSCGCRVITAKPNMQHKMEASVDFGEMGRNPDDVNTQGRTSFEFTAGAMTYDSSSRLIRR